MSAPLVTVPLVQVQSDWQLVRNAALAPAAEATDAPAAEPIVSRAFNGETLTLLPAPAAAPSRFWLSAYAYDPPTGESRSLHTDVDVVRAPATATARPTEPTYTSTGASVSVAAVGPLQHHVTIARPSDPSSSAASTVSAAADTVSVDVIAPTRTLPDVQGAPHGRYGDAVDQRRRATDITEDLLWEPSDDDGGDEDDDTADTSAPAGPLHDSRGIPVDSVPQFMQRKARRKPSAGAAPASAPVPTRAPAPARASAAAAAPLSGVRGRETRRVPLTCLAVNSRLEALSGGPDGSLRLWSAPTGALTAVLSGPGSADVDADLGAGSGDGAAAAAHSHVGDVSACAWFPSERIAISAAADCTVKLWAPELRRCVKTFAPAAGAGHARAPTAFAFFGPAGRQFATVSKDGTAALWDTAAAPDAAPLARWGRLDHNRPLWDCAARGSVLVAGSEAGTIDIIDTRVRSGLVLSAVADSDPAAVVLAGSAETFSLAPGRGRAWALAAAATPVGQLAIPVAPLTLRTLTSGRHAWASVSVAPETGAEVRRLGRCAVRRVAWTPADGSAGACAGASGGDIVYAGLESGAVAAVDLRAALGPHTAAALARGRRHAADAIAAAGADPDSDSEAEAGWGHDWSDCGVAFDSSAEDIRSSSSSSDSAPAFSGPVRSGPVLWWAQHGDAAISALVPVAAPAGAAAAAAAAAATAEKAGLWVGDEEGNLVFWQSTVSAPPVAAPTIAVRTVLTGADSAAVAAVSAQWYHRGADLAAARAAVAAATAQPGAAEPVQSPDAAAAAAAASAPDLWRQRVWAAGTDGVRLYIV